MNNLIINSVDIELFNQKVRIYISENKSRFSIKKKLAIIEDKINYSLNKQVEVVYLSLNNISDSYIEVDFTPSDYFFKLILELSLKEYLFNSIDFSIAAEKFEELLNKTLEEYHNRRASLSPHEATTTQSEAVDSIIRNATQQALDILSKLGEDKDSFRKLGLTFEEKAFYDILMHLRDKYNFEFGEDKKVGSLIINEKCKLLAQKIKELIDVQSSFTDWLNNDNVKADLNKIIFFCLHNNGYPPQHNDEVFDQVMEQVENFKHKN